MSNIVYLLGAGSSALALPPVNSMKGEIVNLETILKSYFQENFNADAFTNLPFPFKENYKQLIPLVGDFRWLIDESQNHETIDTLAKKYYFLNDYTSLKRLKTTLIVYFTIRQLCQIRPNPGTPYISGPIHQLIDPRYDSFIAAIAEKRNLQMHLKDNVKIITWNYDIQMELSLKRYLNLKIHLIKEKFQIFPNHNSFSLSNGDLLDSKKFGMIKLNGNAFWDNPSETGEELKSTLFDEYFGDTEPIKVLGKLLFQLEVLHKDNDKLIDEATRYFNFAWETDSTFTEKYNGYSNNILAAEKIASEAAILVVIGYSFPVFNRQVDTQLFNLMTNLKKVYIQDLNPEKIQSVLKNAFKIFQEPFTLQNPEKVFSLEDNTDHFVLPYEL
jgi:hypothetical protein